MTAQEVIKNFISALANHGYKSYTNFMASALNDAVAASSDFRTLNAVITRMETDQVAAEKEAVEEVLGSEFAGKTISEVSSSILNASSKTYTGGDMTTAAYFNDQNDYRSTVKNVILEHKANIFLEKYCGIKLNSDEWINGSRASYWSGYSNGNYDTGAITGSDANISLTAGDVICSHTLTSADLTTLAKLDGASLKGSTLIFGTGIEKTAESIVPEIGNSYTATTSQAQKINTGSNDWVVTATDLNDTITTGGADYVYAGKGNDSIVVGADYASIFTGDGNDTVTISETVNDVTFGDLTEGDVLKISGSFVIGDVEGDKTLLTITDKSGTRKITLADFDNAKSAKLNGTTIADLLTSAGFNLNALGGSANTAEENSSTSVRGVAEEISSYIPEENSGTAPVNNNPTRTRKNASNVPENSLSGNAYVTNKSNVELDTVTELSGNLTSGGSVVGKISNDYPNISTFTKRGLTINLVGVSSSSTGHPSEIEEKTFDELTDNQKTIIAGLFKWWAKEALKLNEDSYGIGFNSDTAMVNDIGLFFFDSSSSGALATVWNWQNTNSDGLTTKLMINVNMNYYNSIDADDPQGQAAGTNTFLDRTLAHELTHAVMATNIPYFQILPAFIKEGFAELTHGIDDERSNRIFELAYDDSRLKNSLNVSSTTATSADNYAGGYMFLRYFAKQAALQSIFHTLTKDSSFITLSDNDDIFHNTRDGISISSAKGNDFISNDGSEVAFIYAAGDGNDTIQGFGASDTLAITGSDFSSLKSGSNVIISVADNKITLLNAAKLSSLNIGGEQILGKWTISGTTAKFTLHGRTTTITGLKKGVTEADLTVSDDSTIILSQNALGTAKVTIKGDYTLALADGLAVKVNDPVWNKSNTSAMWQQTSDAGYSVAADGKSITYVKEATTVLATVSGLDKNFSTNDLTVSDDNIITVATNALGTSNVSLKGNDYKLALADDVITNPESSYEWIKNNTTANYQATTPEHYTCDEKSITYVKENTATVATLSGLNKDFTVSDLSLKDKTITVKADALDTSNVSLKSNDYTLALASDVKKTPDVSYPWDLSATSAKHQIHETEYYSCDGKSITYVKPKTTLLATISGLKKGYSELKVSNKRIILKSDALGTTKVTISGNNGYKLAVGSDVVTKPKSSYEWIKNNTTANYQATTTEYYSCDGKSINYVKPNSSVVATISGLDKDFATGDFSVKDKTITVAANALGTAKVTLKGDGYKLALASDVTTKPKSLYEWIKSGTTAKYQATTPEYYSCDGKSITYVKPNSSVVATISGLDKDFATGDLSVKDKTITVAANALGTAKVTLKGDGYKLALASDVTTKPKSSYEWIKSGTTAKYQATTPEYYSCDGKSITYVKPNSSVVATLSGLDKDFATGDFSVKDKTITVAANALGTAKVTLKGDGYKLALASDVTTKPKSSYEWIKSGTTAKYQATTPEYYSCDGKSITYVKPNSSVVATISGLDKDFATGDLAVKDKTITVAANALGTAKVTIKGDGYKLAVGSDVTTKPKSLYEWIKSGTTAKYQQATTPEYYSCDGKSINYVKANSSVVATISGLNKDFATGDLSVKDKTITVAANALGTAKVTIKGDDYKLALASDVATNTKNSPNWIVKSSTATLKNVTPAHYTCDGKSIAYVKATELDTLATVNGVKQNLSANNYDAATNTVKLTNADLKDKVTVSGDKAFKFANDYSGSITGSAKADTITVAGNGVSISGGKGDDTIDLGSGSATFFYASGDGNDVIANFTAGTDKFVVTSGKASVAASNKDVVVTVGNGNITLKGAANQSFDIVNKSGATLATYGNSNALLYDDNFSTEPQIDSLLGESADCALGEIYTSNATNLTQDKTQLTFVKK